MEPVPPRILRITESARHSLVRLKTKTGLSHWNTLCRWALTRSLTDPRPPPPVTGAWSHVEMSWDTFSGEAGDVWWLLVRQRALEEGVLETSEDMTQLLVRHLHRGISRLANDPSIRTLSDLVSTCVRDRRTESEVDGEDV